MQELDGDMPMCSKQVAWIGQGSGPKYLYKRDTKASMAWTMACVSGNREAEFAMFQNLRRNGYILVNGDGTHLRDDNGSIMGDKPLPQAKSDISMEAIKAGLESIKALDMSSVPEGEDPVTRLLTLSQRISLMKFTEELDALPRETLVGLALEVSIRVKGFHGMGNLYMGAHIPEWMVSTVKVGDPALLGRVVMGLSSADKPSLLTLLKKLLPEVMRLEGLRPGITDDRTVPLDSDWRDGAA